MPTGTNNRATGICPFDFFRATGKRAFARLKIFGHGHYTSGNGHLNGHLHKKILTLVRNKHGKGTPSGAQENILAGKSQFFAKNRPRK